jgi:6-phosphogluconolactonase (cycloisomerase 2 family)
MPGFRSFSKVCRALTLALYLLSVAVMPQPAVYAADNAQPIQPSAVSPETAKALAALDLPLPNVIVTTTTLANDPADTKCDLWEALQAVFQANYGLSPTYHECTAKTDAMNIIGFGLDAIGGSITIPASGSVTDLPMVHGNTVIVGPIGIQGSPNVDTHILRTAPDAKLTVVAVSLKNTHTAGAGPAILDTNYATINVVASFLTNNDADSDGGAIYSNGDLNLIGTSFIGNHTNSGAGRGGAVYMTGSGSFKSEGSTFTGNKANAGGAIYLEKSSGDAAVNDSIFTGNIVSSDTSGLGGGALYNFSGKVEVQRSAFNANLALQGKGGALVNNSNGTAVITNSLFDGSLTGDTGATVDGGAIENLGEMSVGRSTFVSNTASGSGGAIDAGAGSKTTVFNATLNSNHAGQNGGAFQVASGANAYLYNDTLSSNTAGSSASAINALGNVRIGNTIIDHSSIAASCAGGGIHSLAHNLDRDGSCNMGPGDLVGADPKLGGLAFNGGSLPVLTTQKPAYDSPVVDAGSPVLCGDTDNVNSEDETGTKRPKDANNTGTLNCDIGAIELPPLVAAYNAMPLPPGPLNFGSVHTGDTQNFPLTVTNAGTYPLILGNASLSDNHFGSSSFPPSIDPGKSANLSVSCTPTDVGPITGDFSFSTNDPDRPNITYNMLCNGTSVQKPGFASTPAIPAPIEFGSVVVGVTVTQTLRISNIGQGSLVVSDAQYSGNNGISITFPTTTSIGVGAHYDATVTCTPPQVGLLTGTITFTTTDPSQTHPVFSVNCNGIPLSPYLANTQNLTASDITGLTSPKAVAISADSQNAYVTSNSASSPSSIGVFTILKRITQADKTEGFVEVQHLSGASTQNANVAISPNDRYVILAAPEGNKLIFYRRDSSTGKLSWLDNAQNGTNGVSGLTTPTDIAFSPDSRFLYVACSGDNDVVIFKQDDSAKAKFSYVGKVSTTSDAAHPLTNANSIAISPDGKNLYVTTFNTGGGVLAVYLRNTITGSLISIQTRFQGDMQDGYAVTGMMSTYKVIVSPDGGNVYVTATQLGEFSTYIRDPSSGEVHLPFTFKNTSNILGLMAARGVASSPDGRHLYVLGRGTDNDLVDFNRDLATHYILPFYWYVKGYVAGPYFGGPMNVAASNDGKFVMVTASTDNAVVLFQVANPIPALNVLEPASVTGDANDAQLMVKGSGFVSGAKITFDGTALETTYVSSTHLEATVPASLLATTTGHSVGVTNPGPGGGVSFNTLPFAIVTATSSQSEDTTYSIPFPSIDHLTPGGVKAGPTGFVMDVYGMNFQSDATVIVNGASLPTTVVASDHLVATVSAGLTAQAGTVTVKVRNGTDVYSNKVGLWVSPPGQNPVPSLADVNPSKQYSRGASSPATTLHVYGNNFVDGATVLWNGIERQTSFVDDTHLVVTLPGSDFLWAPSSNGITVRNPGPGGGVSNEVVFQVQTTTSLYLPAVRR